MKSIESMTLAELETEYEIVQDEAKEARRLVEKAEANEYGVCEREKQVRQLMIQRLREEKDKPE